MQTKQKGASSQKDQEVDAAATNAQHILYLNFRENQPDQNSADEDQNGLGQNDIQIKAFFLIFESSGFYLRLSFPGIIYILRQAIEQAKSGQDQNL